MSSVVTPAIDAMRVRSLVAVVASALVEAAAVSVCNAASCSCKEVIV